MSSLSRDRIFSRLNAAGQRTPIPSPDAAHLSFPLFDIKAKIERLKTLMEDMRTEVHVVRSEHWVSTLTEILKNKGIKDLLYASGTNIGDVLEGHWEGNTGSLPLLIPYDRDIEQFKSRLFDIDASITSTAGATADTGAIILWSDEKEPRTMSLVPPVHIAILQAEKIYNNLSEAIIKEGWSDKMPTNALLISGPSKTADIELTLAYGVHGPKELVLLII